MIQMKAKLYYLIAATLCAIMLIITVSYVIRGNTDEAAKFVVGTGLVLSGWIVQIADDKDDSSSNE